MVALHFCTHCGFRLSGRARYCRSCGHAVARPLLLRTATAAAIDVVLACTAGLLAAATAGQVQVLVIGAGTRLAGGVAALAGSLALLGYQPFFWFRHRPSPGQRLLGMPAAGPSKDRVPG